LVVPAEGGGGRSNGSRGIIIILHILLLKTEET
jgi:hypothetical protein